MRAHDFGERQLLVFDSAAEVVTHCNPANFKSNEGKLGRRLPTWASVVAAIDQPWREGLDAVQKFIDRLEGQPLPEIKSIVRRVRHDEDDGDEIDLDRLRAGQPYWRVSRRERSTGPAQVTIVVDLSASKDISATDILWRGAAAIAMAHVLENQGFSVAMWAVQCSCPFDGDAFKRLTIAIPLKGHGDRLDVSTLVNCASGWFYRSVLFTAVRTVVSRQGKKVAAGLGTPESPHREELDAFSDPENRLYSHGSFSYFGAQCSAEYGLEQIRDKQSPPEPEPEPDPVPVPVLQSPAPLPSSAPPKSRAKKVKPVKWKPFKMPKRRTQD